jgi:magnesium transporter
MIEYYKKGKGNYLEKEKTPSPECWVKVVDPSEKEIESLVSTFGMDLEEINDGLDIHETPRIDSEENFVYIHSTVPTESISQDHDSSFLIAISKDKFFTISKHKLEVVESNLDKKKEIKQFSNAKNLFRIFSRFHDCLRCLLGQI